MGGFTKVHLVFVIYIDNSGWLALLVNVGLYLAEPPKILLFHLCDVFLLIVILNILVPVHR